MSAQQFGYRTSALEAVAGIDLSGKTAIVTGASAGLGVETARALAAAGAEVILPVRSPEKGEKATADIRSSTGNDKVFLAELDLIDPDSVRAFTSAYLATEKPLSILINNAGIMATPLRRSKQGYESQFATNHLGHFLLTCLLAPALKAGTPSRVVCLSSTGHQITSVLFDDINFEKTEYDKWMAYGQAKSANALFAVELNRRLSPFGVEAFAVHPGGIMTELQREMPAEELRARGWVDEHGNVNELFKTVEQGASTSVWAATSPDLTGKGGVYCEDCSIAEIVEERGTYRGVMPHARDPEAAKRLWQVSEAMVGQKFDF